MFDFQTYKRENAARLGRFEATYNPTTGEGSVLERFPIEICWEDEDGEKQGGRYFLPIQMLEAPLLQAILKGTKQVSQEVAFDLMRVRQNYDFEYYAVVCQTIKHKKTGLDVPFIMNYAQRAIALPKFERQRLGGKPIRQVVPKARQGGISTFIDAYIEWIQSRLQTGWNSCIVTLIEDQARNIRGMYSNIARHYPKEFGSITFRAFEGSPKNKHYIERDCVISIASVEKPDSLRSGDLKCAHLSEVGLWRETKAKKPEDLIQSIRGSVPNLPNTLIALESSAKGVGNFFHNEYLAALKGDSSYDVCFLSWWNMELYQDAIPEDDDELYRWILGWNEYQKWLWSLGATLEGIMWHTNYLRDEMKGDTWRMGSEFPSTADEAFASTGKRFFPQQYTSKYRQYTREPQLIGDLVGDTIGDQGCMKNITFVDNAKGDFKVWSKPPNGLWKNRYIVSVDIGGRHDKADYSVITVLDRYWASLGDDLAVAARYRCHMDLDLVAWKAAQIATWYGDAELIIESNYIDNKETESEGDNFLTVLDTISEHYENLYSRTSPERIREGAPVQWGFHTNRQTKPMVLAVLLRMYRERCIDEPDNQAINEAETYEIKPNGILGAVNGCHDDIVMSTAIGCWRHENMDACVEITTKAKGGNYGARGTKNESDF